jgi:hypothetical protein
MVGCWSERVLAPIEEVHIWCDDSSPKEYFVYFVSGEPDSCYTYAGFFARGVDDKYRIDVYNYHSKRGGCREIYSTVENTVSIGSHYLDGVTYTVEVNDVVETFTPPIS